MKLTRLIAAVLLFITTATTAKAQFQVEWKVLTNEGLSSATVSNFTSVNEAKSIINEIISVMNIKANFEVREANVPNAGAVFFNNKRYILYNPDFIKQIDRATGTDWAAISILAHEIGHHVKGHVFANNGGTSHENELEADEFSGLVLRRMGATLEEAQIAMKLVAGNRASATHPGKTDRLDAIAKGWNAGTPVTNNDVASSKPKSSNTTANTAVVNRTGNIAARQQPAQSVQTAVSRESAIADQYILVNVNFSVDKKNEYFVTVQNNVVKWDGSKLTIIGKLARLKNPDYPFYIYDSQKNYVLISKSGYLVNEKGSNVGYLSMHTTSATASR
jgi:hypothetical protein